MSFLAVSPQEERQREQNQQLTPGDPDAFKPGLFEGIPGALGTSLHRVFGTANAVAGVLEAEAASLVTTPLDRAFGSDVTGFLREELETKPQAYLASIHPDPRTTGSVGQVLYGLVGIGVPAAVGAYFGGPAGAAAAASGFQMQGTYADLTAQGVDKSTAQLAALEEGAFTAAGVAAPMSFGRSVARNALLYGPGINIAQSLAAGQVIGETLRARGYAEMADRYQALDTETLIADAVLGSAFGYFGARGRRAAFDAERLGTREHPTEAIDAALVVRDVHHAEIDTAPGIPTTDAARRAHVEALARAEHDLLEGRTVDAGGPVDGFLLRDVPESPLAVVAQAMRASGYAEIAAEVQALHHELELRGRAAPEALPVPVVPAAPPTFGDRVAQLVGLRDQGAPASVLDPNRPIVTDAGEVRPAARALAEADVAIARTQHSAKAFEAAVECFLRTEPA
jgi:hypothetical protein